MKGANQIFADTEKEVRAGHCYLLTSRPPSAIDAEYGDPAQHQEDG